ANPTGALRSVALLLRYAAGENELADQFERAVDTALSTTPTRDVGGTATTAEFTDAVLNVGFR
ncbi:MAG: isocitrate/isopropylmalate family dehydrogenase, partial [Gaiellaceae bacterium]